jgi:hypothetical protein
MQTARRNPDNGRRWTLRVGVFNQSDDYRGALERLKAWTRDCLELSEDQSIMVSEVDCRRPGCPQVKTVVVFWDGEGKRRLFRIFKPIGEVVFDDLPPVWLKNLLGASESDETECC